MLVITKPTLASSKPSWRMPPNSTLSLVPALDKLEARRPGARRARRRIGVSRMWLTPDGRAVEETKAAVARHDCGWRATCRRGTRYAGALLHASPRTQMKRLLKEYCFGVLHRILQKQMKGGRRICSCALLHRIFPERR